MPQKFQTERRYVNTFLKLLYYNHALRRFDKTKADRAKDNLLILWADEAQRFMTASEDGTSDYNCVDVIREAGATVVAAAQSTTSLVPPLGNDKAKVLTLNLRNRMIFRAADEADAVQAADFLGKKRVVKRSWGYSAGKRNVNYSETEEHKIKPHKLRNLRDHECVLVHCERGFRRVTLPPLESDGDGCKMVFVVEADFVTNRATDFTQAVCERPATKTQNYHAARLTLHSLDEWHPRRRWFWLA